MQKRFLLLVIILGFILQIFCSQSEAAGYKLPFLSGTSVYITVGNNSGVHATVLKEHYAWDMREAQRAIVSIVAAKTGKVVYVKKDGQEYSVPVGENCIDYKKQFANYANYVVLEHDDGLQSVYLHLAENSVLVNLNDTVNQGQPIGTIGNTGWSCGTHLHFQVQQKGNSWFETSVSVTFDDVNRDGGIPQETFKNLLFYTEPLSF